jgi:hypothetical protein
VRRRFTSQEANAACLSLTLTLLYVVNQLHYVCGIFLQLTKGNAVARAPLALPCIVRG